ncbi:ricin-type beta-trefoil lectin domain protein [Micromonospora deserti]|uniref:ricin-type beta-trefoil lectin domain protein n=1 Tax=Micromonospora deserti TaxID=2070366 RepID=UPI001F2CE5CE|nr:ricin-type beta-trefoil lectin domain protein [Micromonospora deserti]
MQRDLRLSAEQVRARLAREDVAAHTEMLLRQRIGASFAGAWLIGNAETLVVGITDAAQADAVRSAGAKPLLVTHSEQRLNAIKAVLDGASSKATRQVAGWYVDGASNSVVVIAHTLAAGEEFAAASGAEPEAIRVVVSNESPEPLYDVRGGDAYYINNRIRCSIGFSVVGGFVTAGHCGSAGSTTAGHNNVSQGTVQGSSFPGNDYGWVRVNSSWTPRGVVNNYAGGTVAVAGSQEASIGASVCRSGSTTGWRCGTIQAKNQTVNYAAGPVYGMTRTSACAEGGDSGGSFISGNHAQGVTSGGSGNCTSGGTTFFQPVNEILSVYRLTLVTSGGGGGSTFSLVGAGSSKCIDAASASQADGTMLIIYTCHGGTNQRWTQTAADELRIYNNTKCMDAGASQQGTQVTINSCNGSNSQKWTLNANGTISNVQSARCLDVNGGSTANNAAVIVWSCHGGSNQVWSRQP